MIVEQGTPRELWHTRKICKWHVNSPRGYPSTSRAWRSFESSSSPAALLAPVTVLNPLPEALLCFFHYSSSHKPSFLYPHPTRTSPLYPSLPSLSTTNPLSLSTFNSLSLPLTPLLTHQETGTRAGWTLKPPAGVTRRSRYQGKSWPVWVTTPGLTTSQQSRALTYQGLGTYKAEIIWADGI